MKKVLLVEDDPFIRDITSIKLAEREYSVQTAQNGSEALASLEKEIPDVILLDLDLPDISGLEIIEKIKKDENWKQIPVVIFSNNDDPAVLTWSQTLGISGFFIKATTSFDDLHAHLQTLFKE